MTDKIEFLTGDGVDDFIMENSTKIPCVGVLIGTIERNNSGQVALALTPIGAGEHAPFTFVFTKELLDWIKEAITSPDYDEVNYTNEMMVADLEEMAPGIKFVVIGDDDETKEEGTMH